MNSNLQIIVVDDDSEDKQLLKFAFTEAQISNPVKYLEDGEQLVEYLALANGADIAIILLDLNIPRMDGREALRRIKMHPDWKKIPVIIFSTSDSKEDIHLSYSNGAASYLVKPMSFEKLVSSIKTLKTYWMETILLPSGNYRPSK